MNQQPTSLLALLQQQLTIAASQDQAQLQRNASGAPIQVPGTGKLISAAYEQLRNSAEYTEEHLLLQHAIRRFYRRSLFITDHKSPSIGHELVVELTQAGYLSKDSVSRETSDLLGQIALQSTEVYNQLRHAHVGRETATDWALSVLSVNSEGLLHPHGKSSALAYVAFQHFKTAFPKVVLGTEATDHDYDLCLFIAVHIALLKSDMAIVRAELTKNYNIAERGIQDFITLNRTIDELSTSDLTNQLKRQIVRHGGPFRVLLSMVRDRPDAAELLNNKEAFLKAYDKQVDHEYSSVRRRINKGIVKSIIFLFITKVLIGVSLEAPYDIAVHGKIAWLPLIINLLTPPVYMASLGLWLHTPSKLNARQLHDYIESVLFQDTVPPGYIRIAPRPSVSFLRTLLLTILFLVPFALTVLLLLQLDFNILQIVIFFVFLSTASFLGFRLSSMVRELELTSQQVGLVRSIREFFYLPFILFGQWLSGKYARINVVSHILDVAIELPLKTLLRLVRQWVRFVNEKREEIY